jgi:putative hemolysin
MMSKRISITMVFLLGAALLLAACTATTPAPAQPPANLPNPASQNCEKVGGQLSIETRGDGGQYGVCLFEENRQCEEWALLRGDCPAGGLKVIGYVTDAARYCAITGGSTRQGNSAENDRATALSRTARCAMCGIITTASAILSKGAGRTV